LARAHRFDDLDLHSTVEQAARIVVRRLFTEALSQAPNALEGTDVEAVHDMRVALRKLRTALRTFEGALPKRNTKRLAGSSRRLARRLGAVRDADVHLAALRSALTGATVAETDGIAHAIDQLNARRRRDLVQLAIELSQTDRDAILVEFDSGS